MDAAVVLAIVSGALWGLNMVASRWGLDSTGVRIMGFGEELGSQSEGSPFIQHAVQDVEGWEAVKAAIRDQHGRLDVTFSNAGTNAGDSDIETVEVDAWKNLVDI